MVDLYLEQETQNAFISVEERILALSRSWFSSVRSTDSMMRGTINKALVVNALSRKEFVKGIFEVGMIGKKENNWMACSSDGISVIDLYKIPTYDLIFNPETQVLPPWADTTQFDTIGRIAGRCVLASV
jgi:hypothetical protein